MTHAMTHEAQPRSVARKERPILFSAPMVLAILAGRKTVTRRVVKPQPELTDRAGLAWKGNVYGMQTDGQPFVGEFLKHCPYGAPGDRLWVKETVRWNEDYKAAFFVADGAPTVIDTWPWQRRVLPSIHMPRGVCRLRLEVVRVDVQRLHDVTEADAQREGVTPFPSDPEGDCWTDGKHRSAFEFLWNEINGWSPNAWAENPWVWRVEFRRVPSNSETKERT